MRMVCNCGEVMVLKEVHGVRMLESTLEGKLTETMSEYKSKYVCNHCRNAVSIFEDAESQKVLNQEVLCTTSAKVSKQ